MLISDTLRKTLTAKVPDVDFAPYFAFIESCATVKGERHHILPKKEFPEHKRNPDNLICVTSRDHFRAHYWLAVCAPQCESFQRAFFLMANMKRASLVNVDDLPEYAAAYERGREVQRKAAHIQGHIQGKMAVESGLLASLRTHEHQVAAGRIAGRKAVKNGHLPAAQAKAVRKLAELGWPKEIGRRNVENGHIRALGLIQGRKNVENGHLAGLRTPEHQRMAATAAGQKSVESGWAMELGRIYGERAVENGQIQALGRLQGRKNVESGHIQSLGRSNVEDGTLERARHTRWHTNRGISNPACGLCSDAKKTTSPTLLEGVCA